MHCADLPEVVKHSSKHAKLANMPNEQYTSATSMVTAGMRMTGAGGSNAGGDDMEVDSGENDATAATSNDNDDSDLLIKLIKNLQSLTNELIKPLVKPPSDPAARIDLAGQILVSLQQEVDMAINSSLPPTSILPFCKAVQPSVEIVLERVQQQLLDNNPDREARRSATELVDTISKQVSVESTKSASASSPGQQPADPGTGGGDTVTSTEVNMCTDDADVAIVKKFLAARNKKATSDDDDDSDDPTFVPSFSREPKKRKRKLREDITRREAAILEALENIDAAAIPQQLPPDNQCSKCHMQFDTSDALLDHFQMKHRTEQVCNLFGVCCASLDCLSSNRGMMVLRGVTGSGLPVPCHPHHLLLASVLSVTSILPPHVVFINMSEECTQMPIRLL